MAIHGLTRRTTRRPLVLLLALGAGIALGLVATTGSASAAESCTLAGVKKWDGGAGTTAWSDAANWAGDSLPTTTQHVCIPATAAGTEVVVASSVSVKSIDADKPFKITNGIVTLSDAAQPSSFTTLTTTSPSAELVGASNRTISKALNLANGAIGGPGTTTLGALSVSKWTGDAYTWLEGPLVNNGTIRWSGPGSVNFNAATAILTNNKTLALTGDGTLDYWSAGRIINTAAGTISKTAGTSSLIDVALENDGVVTATAGRIALARGTGTSPSMSSSGDYSAAAGGPVVAFVGGDHYMANAGTAKPEAVGPGTVEVSGTAVIYGDFIVRDDAHVNWLGGYLAGPGTKTIAAGGEMVADGDAYKWLQGPLVNGGTFRLLDGSLNFDEPSALFTNKKSFVIDGEGVADFWDGGRLLNTPKGVINKIGGPTTGFDVAVENDGLVKSTQGRLELYRGTGPDTTMTSTGDYTATSTGNAVVAFMAGDHRMAAASDTVFAEIVGPGPVELAGTAAVYGDLSVRSGAQLRWLGGYLSTPGTKTIAAGGKVVTDSASYKWLQGPMVNNGTFDLGGSSTLNFDEPSALFTNNAAFNITTGAGTDFWDGGRFLNTATGTVTKTGGTTSAWDVALENDGVVRSASGRLELYRGTGPSVSQVSTGDYTANADGPVLALLGGDHRMGVAGAARAEATGPGIVELGGTAAVYGDFAVADGAVLHWNGGYLTEPGIKTIDENGLVIADSTSYKWVQGSLVNNGTFRIVNTGTVNFDFADIVFTNNADLELAADGSIDLWDGGRLVNTETGTIVKTDGVNSYIDVPVENHGVVQSDIGLLRLTRGSQLASSGWYRGRQTTGRVKFEGGEFFAEPTVRIGGDGVVELGGNATLSGGLRVRPGATLEMSGGEIVTPTADSEAVINAGAVLRTTGTSYKTFSGRVRNEGTALFTGSGGGLLRFMDGGMFTNNGLAEFTSTEGLDYWSGDDPVHFVNSPLGVVRKTGAGTVVVDVNFDNKGTVEVGANGTLWFTHRLANLAGGFRRGTWDITGTLYLENTTISSNQVDLILRGAAAKVETWSGSAISGMTTNAGRLTLADGATFTISTFTNDGDLVVDNAGTLNVTGAFTQRRNRTLVKSGGTLAAGGGVTLSGGSITGDGQVNGAITNSGVAGPGALTPRGLLKGSSTYTQQAAGVFDAVLNKTSPNRLTTIGAVAWDGTLRLRAAPGYTPAVNDSFVVLKGSTIGGTCPTGAAVDNELDGVTFTISCTSGELKATVSAVTP